MTCESIITGITARQIYSDRGHPGIETTVTTAGGAKGTAVVTAGVSVGIHEAKFAYGAASGFMGLDWKGRSVGRAVRNVLEIIAPKVIGLDAANQLEVDDTLIRLDGTSDKSNLGGNATASVSAAVLQAGAAALDIPLYQHIGGVHASTMPVAGTLAFLGSRRYGAGAKSGGKPSYSLMAYDFASFAEASHAVWRVFETWRKLLFDKLNVDTRPAQYPMVSPGVVKDDRQLWDLMLEAIRAEGFEGRMGFQVDVAATTFYDEATDRYLGLFSEGAKTRDEMYQRYHEMVRNWPFIIIEDPLHELDYEGHAVLTRELGIQIVGDDLFTTNTERVQQGIEMGACNCVLLKVNQIGTITESFDMVELAYHHGYGVMPCDSRGEGAAIADYTVGLGCGHLREGALGPRGNRFLEIEAELGKRARFAGKEGVKVTRWP
jgi:enolase